MSDRLQRLRDMRAWIDAEIEAELRTELDAIRNSSAMRHVVSLYGISAEEILLGVRRHEVTRARHAVAWLLRRDGLTYPDLCRVFGYSKSAALSAVQRVENDGAMKALLLGIEAVA